MPYNKNEIPDCRRIIQHMISNATRDSREQTNLLAEAAAACATNILPNECFGWLEKDERAAFWLWAKIYTGEDFTLGILNSPLHNNHNYTCLYKWLKLSDAPSSHQERMAIIIQLFDSAAYVCGGAETKASVMEGLKKEWQYVYQRPAPLKWLPNDESDVTWAWDSLHKYFNSIPKNTQGVSRYFPPLTEWFIPLNHAEKILAVRATLDLWNDAPDSKQLFLLNLNKAWNQRKLRQKRIDKKAVNTYLRNETKSQLDALAVHYNMRISDMLEKLIKEHYQQIQPPTS